MILLLIIKNDRSRQSIVLCFSTTKRTLLQVREWRMVKSFGSLALDIAKGQILPTDDHCDLHIDFLALFIRSYERNHKRGDGRFGDSSWCPSFQSALRVGLRDSHDHFVWCEPSSSTSMPGPGTQEPADKINQNLWFDISKKMIIDETRWNVTRWLLVK